MKVKLNLENKTCEVIKESGDPVFRGSGWAEAESTFLYHVLQNLKEQGFDLIKKRMWKDGHMVDNTQQYLRTRAWGKGEDEYCLYNSAYAIEDLGEEFNNLVEGESLFLGVMGD